MQKVLKACLIEWSTTKPKKTGSVTTKSARNNKSNHGNTNKHNKLHKSDLTETVIEIDNDVTEAVGEIDNDDHSINIEHLNEVIQPNYWEPINVDDLDL
jgi:hypothetical protein